LRSINFISSFYHPLLLNALLKPPHPSPLPLKGERGESQQFPSPSGRGRAQSPLPLGEAVLNPLSLWERVRVRAKMRRITCNEDTSLSK